MVVQTIRGQPVKLIRQTFLIVALVTGLACSGSAEDSSPQDRVAPVKAAVERMLCFNDYWNARILDPGSYLSLDIRLNQGQFRVEVCGPLAAGPGLGHMFYTGRIRDGEAAIAYMSAYTTADVTGKDTGGSSFERDRKEVETWELHKDHMIMPVDCTPRYDASTPQKEQMMRLVVDTVRRAYTNDRRPGHEVSRVPKLKLIIADFNIDYPATDVIVEPFGEMLTIALHDPLNYDREDYETYGYTWREIFDAGPEAFEAVRQHGIIKEIRRAPE